MHQFNWVKWPLAAKAGRLCAEGFLILLLNDACSPERQWRVGTLPAGAPRSKATAAPPPLSHPSRPPGAGQGGVLRVSLHCARKKPVGAGTSPRSLGHLRASPCQRRPESHPFFPQPRPPLVVSQRHATSGSTDEGSTGGQYVGSEA